MERRLAAIFAADMVGYSRLMAADERGTIERQKTHRSELIDPTISQFRGRIVKTTGDGMLVEFHSIVDAVECALAIQQAMQEREKEVDEDLRIQYRIGINLGDIVIEDDGDILGDGVNIAARLEGLADPGGICISGSAFEHVKSKIEAHFQDLGLQDLKNMAEPLQAYRVHPQDGDAVALRPLPRKARQRGFPRAAMVAAAAACLLALAAVGLWQFQSHELQGDKESEEGTVFAKDDPLLRLPEGPSIALLPFKNLTGDSTQEYFIDGLTAEITTGLTRFQDLFVFAQNTTLQFKDEPVDLQKIGREMGIQYLLEGSVRVVANRMRVNAQLTESATASQVWAEICEREFTTENIFEIQDEITQSIVGAIGGSQGAITRAGNEAIRSRGTDSLQAYECLLRARVPSAPQRRAASDRP